MSLAGEQVATYNCKSVLAADKSMNTKGPQEAISSHHEHINSPTVKLQSSQKGMAKDGYKIPQTTLNPIKHKLHHFTLSIAFLNKSSLFLKATYESIQGFMS